MRSSQWRQVPPSRAIRSVPAPRAFIMRLRSAFE
jgi:hypothetical protein